MQKIGNFMRKKRVYRHVGFMLLLVFLLTPVLSLKDITTARAASEVEITVHYQRADGDYEDWNLWLFEEGGQGEEISFSEEDEYGKTALVRKTFEKTRFGFLVRKGNWVEKDIDADRFFETAEGKAEIWLKSGDPEIYLEEPAVEEVSVAEGDLELRIHYRRFDENYDGWNLWMWPKGGEGEVMSSHRMMTMESLPLSALKLPMYRKWALSSEKGNGKPRMWIWTVSSL